MFVDYLKERSLISTFLNTDRYSYLIDGLNEDDFYNDDNVKYLSAIKRVHESGVSLGLLTVREELLKNHKGANLDLFVDVASAPSNSSEADFNYKKIIELSQKRKLRMHFLQQAEYLENPIVTPEDSCIDTENMINEIQNRTDSKGKVYDGCNDIFGNKGDFIPTGLQGLDNIIIGVERGDMIVIAAKPSQGKTTLLQNIFKNNLDQINLFFSLEMKYRQIKQRILSNESMISRTDIVSDELSKTDKAILIQTNNELKEKYKNLIIYDNIKNIKGIEIECKKQKLKHGKLGLIGIDYLQLAKVDGISERRLQIDNITGRIKDLAGKVDSPIILLSQFTRLKDEEEPTLGHLKESGAIECDTDVAVFIWKDKAGRVWLIVPKNRQGDVGKVRVERNFKYFEFQDYDEEMPRQVNL
jgi:replicative DNA helicase